MSACPGFAAVRGGVAPRPRRPSAVEERLRETDPDALTPREALHLLYELKATLDASRR